ncbi:hypothetical protein A9Q84_16755 [Halobacteriovorax marinus]|uniref:Uncharacterized protein n=1 Tax=Halobacteriovorax marinus TaxID=97084 RepID=A0A1Y5F4H8_9BACT|nr:hypothetical protein A9Q84_16755 [Halobacteriovorax marinus]
MNKNILLVENRAKQMIVTSLNLNIYLDSEVQIVSSFDEFIEAINFNSNIDLIISRDSFNDTLISDEIKKELETNSLSIPHLVLGSAKEHILLDDKLVIRPLLKESARVLSLTPQMMAQKDFGEYFELPSTLVHFINYAPCDIFVTENGIHFQQAYTRREQVSHEVKIDMAVCPSMFVRSNERLEFVNSLTEQNREDYLDSNVVNERFQKEVERINKDMDTVSNLLTCGVDSEKVNEIAVKAVKSMIALADEDIVVKDLINRLNESDSNFRYKHSQLITFIGLQVLKQLERSDQDLEDFASAAFFHDICIKDDEIASVRSNKSLLMNDFSIVEMDQIRNHALDANTILKRLNSVNEKTMDIITQHHGSTDGQGFSDSLKGITYLSKAFVITEHWVHIQLFEDQTDPRDLSQFQKVFLKLYPGKSQQEFIKTLFQLESKELISGVTEDLTQELINIKGAYEIDEHISLVKGLAEEEDTSSTKISGVTDHIKEESKLVKGSDETDEDKSITHIKGETEEDKSTTVIKGEAKDLKEENYIINGNKEKSKENLSKTIEKNISEDVAVVDNTPKINGEILINAYISKRKELKEEVGGDWAFSKFLSTLMTFDNPLSSSPFTEKINSIGLQLKECLEDNSELDSFTAQIKELRNDIKNKFEEEITNTIDNRDKSGRTKLMIAITTSNIELYNYILKFNPDFKLTDSTGKSALHFSCISGNLEILESVYEKNTSALNKSDSKKRTALFYAVNSDNLEFVQFLIKVGSRPRMVADNGISPCMMACHNGNKEILEALVANGEPLDAVDSKYKGCYQYAKQKKHKHILSYLKAKGIDK